MVCSASALPCLEDKIPPGHQVGAIQSLYNSFTYYFLKDWLWCWELSILGISFRLPIYRQAYSLGVMFF